LFVPQEVGGALSTALSDDAFMICGYTDFAITAK
jgi:hypothetical protein